MGYVSSENILVFTSLVAQRKTGHSQTHKSMQGAKDVDRMHHVGKRDLVSNGIKYTSLHWVHINDFAC